MATTLYRENGTQETLRPANGVHWSLGELQTLVGGYIEVVSTVDGRFMVIDEEGKLKHKDLNIPATRLYIHGRRDVIVGPAVVVDTRQELDTPDDEEDSDG
jgi:SRSO17 transposase